MFDRHHYHHHDTVQRTTITEQRAPTDESVRLLRDMEDRAEKKILNAVRVENTPVDMVIHYSVDPGTMDPTYACIFKINGEKRRVIVHGRVDKDVAVEIRDAVAKDIASLICADTIRKSLPKLKRNVEL